MTVSGAIASLASGTYSLRRRTRAALDAYGRSSGAMSDTLLSIPASVQPVSGTDVERLPQGGGESVADWVVVYAATELSAGSASANRDADRLTYRGEEYEVQSVEPWNESGGYYRALARKVRP